MKAKIRVRPEYCEQVFEEACRNIIGEHSGYYSVQRYGNTSGAYIGGLHVGSRPCDNETGWNYDKAWEDALIEKALGALSVHWLTSGNNELEVYKDHGEGTMMIYVDGRRHGIPWWVLGDCHPALHPEMYDGYTYEETQREDILPWETTT